MIVKTIRLFQNLRVQSLFRNSSSSKELIKINIKDDLHEFPAVWLRDNCQCEKCFHHSSQSRIIKWQDFNVDVAPAEILTKSNSFEIKWNDGHYSKYNYDWLHKRSFNKNLQQQYDEVYRPTKKMWSSKEFTEIMHCFNYNSILMSDNELCSWLQSLAVYGITLIKDAPKNNNTLDQLISKVGFIKKTHYGETFVLENKPNANNVAYLSSNLQMHTDLPYYNYVPGVTFLHCLEQTKDSGGFNTIVDAHYVANLMRENFKEAFEILCNVNVEWCDIGSEDNCSFFKLYRAPVICIENGQIARINSSIPQRGSYFPTEICNVQPWYKAYKTFTTLIDENVAKFKTNPGQILVFDNIRLLHGRTAYNDTSENIRKLIGCYVDWDEIYSRLRSLNIKIV